MKSKEADIHYISYLDSLPQAIITTDCRGIIENCNRAAYKLCEIEPGNLSGKGAGELLLAAADEEQIELTIGKLMPGESVTGKYQLMNASGSLIPVRATLSAIQNMQNECAAAIISIEDYAAEHSRIYKLERINHTLANLGEDYLKNINLITSLCGELLNGTCALYNRLENELLCSFGQWNTPPDYNSKDKPDGHICYDVIKKAKNEIYYVRNLPKTSYADTDPNVLLYKLKTYIGHLVRCNGKPVGSLCVVFQHDYEDTETDRYLMSLLALALEGEETRESYRKSRNRFSELFDFAVEGILISSPEGIITSSNNSISKLSGFQNEELVGKHISEIFFTQESIREKPFRFDLLRQNKPVITEREIKCKDSRIVTVEMHTKKMPDLSNQTVIFDITRRKEAELKLRQSESTYRGIINSLNDAIYILDKEGCFVDVNVAAEHLYGYEKEFFLGKNPGFLSAPGKNDMNLTIRYIDDAFNGIPIRFEFWGLRKDGSVFPKEVSLSPGMWFGQKVVLAVGREISERKQAEDLLKVNEEKYRLLVQYSSDPIFSFNADDSYRFVNDAFARQFGRKPEEIIGKTPYDIFPHDEAEKRLRLIHHVFGTGEKGEIEVKVNNALGEEKYYLTMADPIKDSQNNILWVTCISKEITQRKKAEEELRIKNEQLNSINAEKDKFFSIVAHDLRGPMNGFLGLTEIMAEEIESLTSNELREIASTMRSSAVNIYRLIENLLEWSRLQRGAINFEPQPMFLKSSLLKSIEVVKDAIEKKEIEIKINIPEYSVVNADVHMLETVIRNLLSNAIKFSHKGGIIEISSSKTENKMICFEIKDYGIGMSPDLISKLFSLTENTSRKGTEGEPSTGLGLILCKEFVEKQGGKLWTESTEGQGSTFVFTLPQS